MRTTHELFIGGPHDGQTLLADATMPYWVVPMYDDLPVRSSTGSPFADKPMVQTARYRRLYLGHRVVFVHEHLSDERAVDRLLTQYFPPAP